MYDLSPYVLFLAVLSGLTASAARAGEWSADFTKPQSTIGVIDDVAATSDGWVAVGSFRELAGSEARYVAVSDDLLNWSQLGPSLNGYVDVVEVFRDRIVIAGSFDSLLVGSREALPGLAEWSDGAWRPVGSAVVSGRIDDMVVYQDRLIVAGSFELSTADSTYDNVAAWDGIAWQPVIHGLNGSVRTLHVANDQLFMGGSFNRAGVAERPYVLGYNGDEHWALGKGPSGSVQRIADLDGDLYVAQFAQDFVSRWDGTNWLPLSGTLAYFGEMTLVAYDGVLIAGGVVGPGSPPDFAHIAAWREGEWTDLDERPDDSVNGVFIAGDRLVVSGYFQHIGDRLVDQYAVWDASGWNTGFPPGLGVTNEVKALTTFDGHLWAGGYSHPRFVHGDGTSWTSTGWWSGPVFALAEHAGHLYAGGVFRRLDWSDVESLAEMDDNGEWLPVGGGVEYGVNALLSADDLIVGGNFTYAGTVTTGHIAAWDDSEWNAMDGGMNDQVRALARFRGTVVAGGDFTMAGGSPASHIAAWNGSEWMPLGDGFDDVVRALCDTDDGLIASGDFRSSGGRAVSHIARWDGRTWTPLGTGLDGSVHALTVSGRHLVVGGSFGRAGSVDASNIAHWDGAEWRPVDAGVGGRVSTIAFYDGVLYAGGLFTTAGGVESMYIGAWRGSFDSSPTTASMFRAVSPHPASRDVAIHYVLPEANRTKLTVHDVAGRRVATILDATRTAGAHTIVWRATDGSGRDVPAGVYFLRLTSGTTTDSRRLVVIR